MVGYLIAGLVASGGLAMFFYRCWILEKERRRHDRKQIKLLRAMLKNRERLNDPDAVERVLDAFERPDDGLSAGPAGDADSGGAGGDDA